MGPMEFGLFRRWRAERSWGYLSPGSGCTLKHSRVSCFFLITLSSSIHVALLSSFAGRLLASPS